MENNTEPQMPIRATTPEVESIASEASFGDIVGFGFKVFAKNWLQLCICSLVAGVAMMIPVAGIFIQGILIVRLSHVLLKAVDGETVDFQLLISGWARWWQAALPNLAMVCVFGAAMALIAAAGAACSVVLPVFLVGAIFIPLSAILYIAMLVVGGLIAFWPLFVADKNLPEWDAVTSSVQLSKKNIITLILLAVVALIILAIGGFLMFIGLIPAIPLVGCMVAAFYRSRQPKTENAVPPSEAFQKSNHRLFTFIGAGLATALLCGGIALVVGGASVLKKFSGSSGSSFFSSDSSSTEESTMPMASAPKSGLVKQIENIATQQINQSINEISPDLEVTKIDSQSRKIVIRHKPSGETLSTTLETFVQDAPAFLEKFAGAATSAEAKPSESAQPAATMESATETSTSAEKKSSDQIISTESTAKAPAWVGLSGNVKLADHQKMSVNDNVVGTSSFTSSLAPAQQAEEFKSALQKSGVNVEVTTIEGDSLTITVSGSNDAGKQFTAVINKSESGGSQGQIQYSETKIKAE